MSKINRIGYRLVPVNLFILFMLLWKGEEGILSWQTIPSLVGLNAFLGWFGRPNVSPFGAGMWFFSVLWLFYLVYPILEKINRRFVLATFFILSSFIVISFLYFLVPMTYMLWGTVFAFLYGVYRSKHVKRVPCFVSLAVFLASSFGMAACKWVFHWNDFNYFWIMICSLAVVHFLLECKLPSFVSHILGLASGCVMEIYFIHSYLIGNWFPGSVIILNYLIYLIEVVCVALVLSRLSGMLRLMVMAGTAR